MYLQFTFDDKTAGELATTVIVLSVDCRTTELCILSCTVFFSIFPNLSDAFRTAAKFPTVTNPELFEFPLFCKY